MFYIIDSSVYVFRAWFSLPDDMVDREGNPVNALYGFTRFLCDFLEYTEPQYVAAAFDSSLSTCFRNDIYPAYKANRDPAPAELKQQFARCMEVANALGIQTFVEKRYEADDIIGTLVHRMRANGVKSTILTRDKDMLQLLDAGDICWDYAGGIKTEYSGVAGKIGVSAEQVVDFLALAGDSVDNIPGVPGVGPKTAIALLNHFGDIDQIYRRLDEVAGLNIRGSAKLGQKLANHREDALIARQLTRIACDIPLDHGPETLTRAAPDMDRINELYDAADFGLSLRRQAERLVKKLADAA